MPDSASPASPKGAPNCRQGTRADRLIAVWLFSAAAFVALLLVAVALGAGEGSAVPHPEFAPMLQVAGDARFGAPLWAGLVVGVLTVSIMGTGVTMGIVPRARFHESGSGRIFIALFAAYALVLAGLVRAVASYDALGPAQAVPTWGGFTLPAAWLVYGVGLGAVPATALVIVRFGAWCYGDHEERRFRELLALVHSRARGDGTETNRRP